MNNKNAQKSDSLLSCLSYKGAHSSDKLKLRCYNFKGFLSIYSIPYGNPATFFFLILLLLPFFPFPKGSQLVLYPNNSNKPQTNTKIHNQTKKKGWAYSKSLLNWFILSTFSHHLFYLTFSPSYIKTKHIKQTKLKQINPNATNTHTPSSSTSVLKSQLKISIYELCQFNLKCQLLEARIISYIALVSSIFL